MRYLLRAVSGLAVVLAFMGFYLLCETTGLWLGDMGLWYVAVPVALLPLGLWMYFGTKARSR